jgi:hypothetical protein
MSAIRAQLRLEDTPGRLGELEEMARDFVAMRTAKERHNWRSESHYRRLQMLGAAALIGDPDVRRLVEALTAIELPSQNALAALVDRLTVLRYERPKPLG